MTKKEIEYLVSGYKKFRQKYFNGNNQVFEELKEGQNPQILIIACSDSRVDPAIILNCKPGDLFVIRNVANLVPPYENDSGYHGTSAALEFAILGLGIQHIIIFGHSSCGGIKALIESSKTIKSKNFITRWMEIAQDSYQETVKDLPGSSIEKQVSHCAHLSLINSLNNLFTFPWIKEKIDSKELFVHSWFFDIESGIIEELNLETKKFEELKI